MAGELTASTPTVCTGGAEIKVAIDLLTLAATTDKIAVVPIPQSNNQFQVFKVERAA